ncbi:PadR family transcriptional regulator [Neobacillus notoginsengisoli]|uniref:PadR family transcriptional regulator n=1 Tax=Neobacillus notoginsengisoli TaxID=1578198 RepID=UPI0026924A41
MLELNKYLPLTETTYYILLSLLEPAHGYIMMQKVEELSNQKVKIAAGTMYGAIENLLKQKLITAVKSTDKRRKTYVITEKGREVLRQDCERMKHIVQITEKFLPLEITRDGGMENV